MMKKSLLILFSFFAVAAMAQQKTEVLFPGITKVSYGEIDEITPYSAIKTVPMADALNARGEGNGAFNPASIAIEVNSRGTVIDIPLVDGEQLYGFGLQMGSYQQRGLKKKPIVNDYPVNNLGPSHGAQTFYVSNKGYGILVNTARYATFLNGTHGKRNEVTKIKERDEQDRTMEQLYGSRTSSNNVRVDIPGAKGIEVFIFAGDDLRDAIEKYNLFSGGGALPPMWGLGIKYRTLGDGDHDYVNGIADYFREKQIPCDVLGFEPGWQTRAYSCSYVWNRERFPDPAATVKGLGDKGFKVNLWEHAYVNSQATFHEEMKPYSGDYEVWGGLVPDFLLPEARKIFTDYHQKNMVDIGIMGFKMDECDGSNVFEGGANWGFPDHAKFPSGAYGDQTRQLFGAMYASTIDDMYRANNLRTYADYRASTTFMSSLPGVLYSDTYNHKEYIQMISNAGFGGLLWAPELRETNNETELFQRMQTLLMSAQAVFNNWYMPSPSWLQYDRWKNNSGEMLPNATELEDLARTLINQRMELIPYLYTTFANYHFNGTPPFRGLVVDYPTDKNVFQLDDQFMIGNDMMAAPFYGGAKNKDVYFPEGTWYNLYTREKYEGGQTHKIAYKVDQLPLFVKENSIIPMAAPVQSVAKETKFEIECRVFGDGPQSTRLYVDDGESYDFEKGAYAWMDLTWNGKKGKESMPKNAAYKNNRYVIKSWTTK